MDCPPLESTPASKWADTRENRNDDTHRQTGNLAGPAAVDWRALPELSGPLPTSARHRQQNLLGCDQRR